MARNQEKAQSMLNKFLQAKKDAEKGPVQHRPYVAAEVTDLTQCERWRTQIVREISKEVTLIQNGSMGEHKIRDMNDKINKLMREKRHWEVQIKKLGGVDYEKSAPRVTDADGKRAVGSDGYFYFGAARELPGVRELFNKAEPEAKKRLRGDLYKLIDADYYGYKDEDDGLLVKLEQVQEKKSIKDALVQWKDTMRATKRQRLEALGMNPDEELGDDEDEDEDELTVSEDAVGNRVYKAHVPLPSQEEIEKALLERKKKELKLKFLANAQ